MRVSFGELSKSLFSSVVFHYNINILISGDTYIFLYYPPLITEKAKGVYPSAAAWRARRYTPYVV